MRVLKWLGRGVAIVLGLTVVAIGGVYAQSHWKLSRRGTPPARAALAVTPDSQTLALGRKLTTAYGCTDCHSESLGGKVFADDPAFGRLVASNLTAGAGGVLATYDDRALDAAIRDGVAADGRKLMIMPSNEYAGLADADVAAIIADIRSRAPVNNQLPPMSLRPIARALVVAGKLPVPYDVIDHARPTLAVAPPAGTLEQGRYGAAGCVGCHGADYGGADVPGAPPGSPPSSNLTPSGPLGQWSEAQFVQLFRTGTRPDGTKLQALMPWQAFGKLSDAELQGIFRYLRTLPPKSATASD